MHDMNMSDIKRQTRSDTITAMHDMNVSDIKRQAATSGHTCARAKGKTSMEGK